MYSCFNKSDNYHGIGFGLLCIHGNSPLFVNVELESKTVGQLAYQKVSKRDLDFQLESFDIS